MSSDTREVMGYVHSGLAYLDRYGGPRARVLRTLERRAHRKKLEGEDARDIIAKAMAKLDALKIMDDGAFAASKAGALRRKGISRRAAFARLRNTGLDAETASAALDAIDSESDDPEAVERTAARRFAQRRRFGPFRPDPTERRERRDRDVAAMARAGFQVGLAMEIIDATDDD